MRQSKLNVHTLSVQCIINTLREREHKLFRVIFFLFVLFCKRPFLYWKCVSCCAVYVWDVRSHIWIWEIERTTCKQKNSRGTKKTNVKRRKKNTDQNFAADRTIFFSTKKNKRALLYIYIQSVMSVFFPLCSLLRFGAPTIKTLSRYCCCCLRYRLSLALNIILYVYIHITLTFHSRSIQMRDFIEWTTRREIISYRSFSCILKMIMRLNDNLFCFLLLFRVFSHSLSCFSSSLFNTLSHRIELY